MKRKLNERDVPEEVTETVATEKASKPSFTDFGLDARLLQAITSQKFATPTSVQQQAIPLALAGKDVLGMNEEDYEIPLTDQSQLVPKPDLARRPPMSFPFSSQSSSAKQTLSQTSPPLP